MRRKSLIKKPVTTCLLLAVFTLGSGVAYGYHDTLLPGAPMQGGRYWSDPRARQLGQERRSLPGGGEQPYGNWRAYGWTNSYDRSMGYSNSNTGTNMICVGADCNFAR
jgi:hypothetical protein